MLQRNAGSQNRCQNVVRISVTELSPSLRRRRKFNFPVNTKQVTGKLLASATQATIAPFVPASGDEVGVYMCTDGGWAGMVS